MTATDLDRLPSENGSATKPSVVRTESTTWSTSDGLTELLRIKEGKVYVCPCSVTLEQLIALRLACDEAIEFMGASER